MPVVLAVQEEPEAVAALLAIPGEELLGLLEVLDIRPFGTLRTLPRAQALAQEAADEALRALNDLHLGPS